MDGYSMRDKGDLMTVTKTIDLSGRSTQSLESAIEEAISRASLTISDVEEFEIERMTGTVKDGRVDEYRVWLRVTFIVKERLHE
jgi:flavin-binding protein dodecin